MAVVVETTLGDITVDLFLKQRPVACLNFLKLCKMKYYNFNLFHSIRSGFIAQTGDPTGEGSGGESIWGILEGPKKRFFSGEKMPRIRHTDAGLLSMVCTEDMMVGSQFFFTLAPDLDSLDGQHCVIGEVTEGHDVLRKLNEVICDESHRPYRDVRITHTVILEDPFNDPIGMRAPSRSPSPNVDRLRGGRIGPDEEVDETQGKSLAEVQEIIEEKEAKARATILEIIGDLPDAEIAPPENVLFVCKLNPVTTDEDLEIIFSRFGKIVSCEVIRDKKTGDSLQYAFIEFSDKKSCEDAYFKMDNVLIDDRRIHVDFSQSVSKMKWLGKGRGVKHFTDEEIKQQNNTAHNNRAHSRDRNPRSRRERRSSKDKHDDNRHSERERREHRHSDRDRHNNKYERERDKHNDRDRSNRNDTNVDKKHRHRTDTSKDYKESSRDMENGKNCEKANSAYDTSHNLSRNKLMEDSKILPKDRKTKMSPERTQKDIEHRSDRRRESENTKTDGHRRSKEEYKERREWNSSSKDKYEERRSQYPRPKEENEERREPNSHAHQETIHKDQKYRKDRPADDKADFEVPSKQKEMSKRDYSDTDNNKNDDYIKNKSTDKNPIEPKTPSPSPMKKAQNKIHQKKSTSKKSKSKDSATKKRKKRKRSSSSSSDSESDSSSSSSTSSSDESVKKKKSKRKRKYSTSSTSSSSSDSSSSSSSTSSDSSSDSEPKKKKCKKNNKKKSGSKK